MADTTIKSKKLNVKSEEIRRSTSHFLLLTLIAAFFALSLINNIALPIFEAPDESSHFIYANYLANEKRLPNLNGELPAHEVIQPPLYYTLIALAIAPFDRSNLDSLVKLNPDWFDKDLNADFASVRGQHLHTDAERWPWQSAVWAIHIARFVSTLLGAATIVFVYLIARSVFNVETRFFASLLAAALVAFNPKFIHVASIVSNDIAIAFAATLALWWMVRLAAPLPGGRGWERVRYLALGALIGIAVLCKLQGLALFVPAAVVILSPLPPGERSGEGVARTIRLRCIAKRLLVLLLGFALVAGWYFVYNTVNYGNPLAWAQVQAANATLFRQPPLDLQQIFATVPLWFSTYWGSPGIRLDYPEWVNSVFAVALGVAVIGCVIATARRFTMVANRTGLLVLVVAQLAILALFVAWLRSYIATENSRLIFAGIAPVAVLVVLGWMALLPSIFRRGVAIAVLVGMAVLSLVTPFTTILPAYATPETLPREQLASRYALPNADRVATFGGDILLLHARLNHTRVNVGESLGVTLYWGGARPMNQSYRVVLEALDLNNEIIGRKFFIPFNGRFATQRWQPDVFFSDDYMLPIDPDAQRGVTRVQLSIFAQYPTPGLLPLDNATGNTFLVGRAKVDAPAITPPNTNETAVAVFGNAIRLDRTRMQANQIEFDWRVLHQPDKDYTLFVHVLDANGNKIGQQDAQPFDGQYPTGLWERGERVRDTRTLALPPEARQVRIGWYDAHTGQRLPAQKADGSPWRDDIVLIEIR